MAALHPLHTLHSRSFHDNKFVYPVISRRSQGLSVGINLNPDKVCNFDCVYCQVDRRSTAETKFVATEALLAELDGMLRLVTSGELWADPEFSAAPEAMRRLNDIAFSGDGEPTTFRNFDLIAGEVAALKRLHGLADVKLVLITNASMFHRPACQRALALLARENGEIWAKLDAGTEGYYKFIERTTIPFARILANIAAAAQERPIVIQSLFMEVAGVGPSAEEIAAYADRLAEVIAAGGRIKRVQVYTVARPPAESNVTPLETARLDEIAGVVRQRTGLSVDTYAGRRTSR